MVNSFVLIYKLLDGKQFCTYPHMNSLVVNSFLLIYKLLGGKQFCTNLQTPWW